MTPHDLHAIAEIATSGILNSLLAGIAIALVAWVVTLLFGRQGAGTRFAVWFLALVSIAILPWVRPVGRRRRSSGPRCRSKCNFFASELCDLSVHCLGNDRLLRITSSRV